MNIGFVNLNQTLIILSEGVGVSLVFLRSRTLLLLGALLLLGDIKLFTLLDLIIKVEKK